MIDAEIKNVLAWFTAEFNDFDLTISPLMTGVRIIVKKETKTQVFATRKDLLIGRDYKSNVDVADAIRAAIPATVEEIKRNMIAETATGQQSFFNYL